MTLEEAIVYLLDEFHLGDCVYDVRERAIASDPAFTEESWTHPKVRQFAEAVDTLERSRVKR